MAGRICTVCKSAFLAEVDRAIIAGETPAALSRRYALSHDALSRHGRKHLGRTSITPASAADGTISDVGAGSDRLVEATVLQSEALSVLRRARKVGALDVALKAIDAAARLLELAARIDGRLVTGTRIGIQFAGRDDASVRDRILRKLDALSGDAAAPAALSDPNPVPGGRIIDT